jgi:hypothetical protein
MTLRIECPTGHKVSSVADLPNAAEVLSLLDRLNGCTLDQGTAAIVARLTAELRNPTGARAQRRAEAELRQGHEFDDGFVHLMHDLAARLKKEGGATLEVSESASWLTLSLSGDPKIVEAVEREIHQASLGAVDLRWV